MSKREANRDDEKGDRGNERPTLLFVKPPGEVLEQDVSRMMREERRKWWVVGCGGGREGVRRTMFGSRSKVQTEVYLLAGNVR